MAGAAGEGSASSFEIAQDEAVAIKDKYANKQKLMRRRVDQYKVSSFSFTLLIADKCALFLCIFVYLCAFGL